MTAQPLADKLRPIILDQFVGQEHLVGKNGIIKKLLENAKKTDFFPSLIFWGPPGSGKTTLARIIAKGLERDFFDFSAVNTSVKDIEKTITEKETVRGDKQLRLNDSEKKIKKRLKVPVIFIDEIHRFNKAQQDALLPHVEKGTIVFLGATTENPSFEVIGPLLSRCRVVVLKQLEEKELSQIINRALDYLKVNLEKEAQKFLINSSNGDARVVLNVLEIAANISKTPTTRKKVKLISLGDVETGLQKRQLTFDLKGEEFYNTISAFHKSIRGSDSDAALYWLARMLEAGQDPLYIGRRLIRVATEDIGLSQPNALLIANAAFEACEKIGLPECNLALAEATVYLAKCPKSNALYLAYSDAANDVHQHGNLPVPLHIRNPVTKLMKGLGYGKDYKYYHDPQGKKLPGENYLPEKLKRKKYFENKDY